MASESGSGEIDGVTASSGGPRPARVFVALKMAPEIADELAQIARELELSGSAHCCRRHSSHAGAAME